jgi:hypothetical protein
MVQAKQVSSTAALGEDDKGNALFIFTRSPQAVHDLVVEVKNISNLSVRKMMYLEGGPEASFFLIHDRLVSCQMGGYETGFNENDENNLFWDVPNVIGIRAKIQN